MSYRAGDSCAGESSRTRINGHVVHIGESCLGCGSYEDEMREDCKH